MRRRRFIATSAGVSAVLASGCAGLDEDGLGGETDDQQSDGSTSDAGELGTFRLLISDMPADIGDFDSLDVWFSSARVFRGDGEEEDADEDEGADDDEETNDEDGEEETDSEDAEDGEEETDAEDTEDDEDSEEDDEAEDEEGEDEDEPGGFVEFELDDAKVDLTEVVGERAMPVLEDELEAGTYSGVHLFVEDVEGIVEGEDVSVKVPSEKLQIIKPFEIGTEETVSFVFDINVVKRGNNDEYNLLPVVAKSGVNGEDVEVDEVEDDEESEEEDAEEGDEDEDSTDDGNDGGEDSSNSGDEAQDQSDDGDAENGDEEDSEET